MIRATLLATGRFSEEDIRYRWGLAHYISPHQWLVVRIDGEWMDVDTWGRAFGVPFGENAAGLSGSWWRKWVE